MKKYIPSVLISLAIGLLGGYFIFGGTSTALPQPNSQPNSQVAAPPTSQIWTCSMDPQVQQNEAGDCPICGMDLIPLSENTSNNPLVFEMTEQAAKLANIQTTVLGNTATGTSEGLKLNGKIQADETKAASLVAHIPGRIEKLYVSFTGEAVKAGQRIATVYSPDLIAAQRELLEAQKIIDISPKLLEAARKKLLYWKISTGTVDRILASGTVQEYFDIYAEHSGIVKQRKVSVGDYLTTGEVLFDIQSLSTVWVLFDVYEEDLSKIKINSKVRFQTPSLANKTFKANISFIDPIINATTRVATIRAEVGNRSKQLKPEMFVTGTTYQAASKTVQLTVPKTAVLWTGERSVVYVKQQNVVIPSFEFREVELGGSLGGDYFVVAGLESGEEVVTNGAFVIDASAQLNNQASMMNRNVKVKGVPESDSPAFKEPTPAAFKAQLATVVENYLLLKEAFVETDGEKASSMISQLQRQIQKVDPSPLGGKALAFWKEQQNALEAHSKGIAKSSDVEEQRVQFDFLSQALITTVRAFGVKGTYYVQHCPMAFDDKGADWLSREKQIRNPYFGDKMMKCGIVKHTLEH